jgi:hypothetical protein
MTPAEYRIRCRTAESCLPDAEYRARLTALHDDMLTEIEALREALERLIAERKSGLASLDAWDQARAALARTGEKT